MTELSIETAKVFKPLLAPARYKAAKGGRGSGKSRFFGGLLIEEHIINPGMRSVCIREVQKTLKDSAKRLIEDRIIEYDVGAMFEVQNDCIKTPGDGIIIFQGMSDHTAESIKSLEGFDRAWIEEAQTLSSTSLELLRPTLRKPGSQMWFSWNPRRKSDPVDMFFNSIPPPPNSIIVTANWSENPWFQETELEQERLHCLETNPDQYQHIWEGDYISVSTGAYYAKSLAQAKTDGRITTIPIDPLMSFYAFWDIGGTGARADACAIWVAQFVGREIRMIDYYEAIGQELSEHVHWMRSRGYGESKTTIILPHDAKQHEKIQRVTYESALVDAGYTVDVLENQGAGAATGRIEALRRLFPSIYFDEKKTEPGREALGWYHEKRDENRGVGLGPDHDWSSHCADAAGLMAVWYETKYKASTGWRSKPVDYSKLNRMVV